MKIMASGPIISWQTDEETMETVRDFIFLGSKITAKNWCFWTVVLEKTLESPLDCKEIQPVHSEGDQPWVCFGRTDAKAEAPIFWPPHAKSLGQYFGHLMGRPIRKDSDVGKDRKQEEKGKTEDEMVRWHHWLNGHEFEQVLEDGKGQGSLECFSPWGHKELDTTDWLNNNNKRH